MAMLAEPARNDNPDGQSVGTRAPDYSKAAV
jgi:hypothetical protein